MRRQLVAICAALLCALAGGPSVSPGAAAPWPVWLEVPWSFPIDQWGKGKAFTCKAADCGTAVTVYVRAKIGFCNCSTGVADDEELDRISGALPPQALQTVVYQLLAAIQQQKTQEAPAEPPKSPLL